MSKTWTCLNERLSEIENELEQIKMEHRQIKTRMDKLEKVLVQMTEWDKKDLHGQ